jgi:glyoxalase/bleomycin resistance protein/dioxygenase superfamily protein
VAITGVHCLLYTEAAEALRETLRDVFEFPYVDARDGWLIFALPPAELAAHPAESPAHELTFMCDDLDATMRDLASKGIEFRGEPENQGFGIVATMVLPGGVDVMLYEPRHKTAIDL